MRVDSAEPWQRQPGESAKSYAAFQIYRSLGPGRSIRKAFERHQEGISGRRPARVPGCWTRWGWKNDWARRAQAWDAHLASEEDDAAIDCRRRVQERHQAQLAAIVGKVIAALETVDFTMLTPLQFIRCVEKAILLERLIHMDPITGKLALETVVPLAPVAPAPVQIQHFEPPPGYVEEVLAILNKRRALARPEPPVPLPGERSVVAAEEPESRTAGIDMPDFEAEELVLPVAEVKAEEEPPRLAPRRPDSGAPKRRRARHARVAVAGTV
jgi:hypothetical protein